MRKMTEQNLRAAFAGESQANMKYLIFSEKAEKEGKPNVARLFKAIAFAEQVHATNHFKTLHDLGDTSSNLQSAIDGVAKLQNEKGAIQSIYGAFEAEKIHSQMYKKAKNAVGGGKDVSLGAVFICDVCGYTVEGEAPDTCPICKAKKDRFKKF